MTALRDLRRTDVKELLKLAVDELVAHRALELRAHESPAARRRSKRRLTLVAGPEPVPDGRLLRLVADMVAGAPQDGSSADDGRDLSAVAKHLAGQPRLRQRVLEAAFADLEARGLITVEDRRALRVFPRRVSVRTGAGEAVLAGSTVARRKRAGSGGGGASPVGAGGGEGSSDRGRDQDFDASFDSGGGGGGGGGADGGGGGGDGGGGGA